ncbi:hypothetical protein D3C84_530340 [compost metagenome]
MAQQVVAPHRRERPQRLDTQRIALPGLLPVHLRQLVDQGLLLGAQGHAARRRLGHGGPARLELGNELLAQEVAIVAHILVALILHPAIGQGLGQRRQLGPADLEQRAQQAAAGEGLVRHHARQPPQSGAALERQQQGLQLIVLMMGGEQPLPLSQACGEALVAGLPRLGLQAVAAAPLQLHPLDHEGHRQLPAHLFTMGHPVVGVRAQAVVDVQGTQGKALLPGKTRRQHQQHSGVEPATEGHQQAPGTFRRGQSLTKTRINTRNHRLPQYDQADLSRVGLIKR